MVNADWGKSPRTTEEAGCERPTVVEIQHKSGE